MRIVVNTRLLLPGRLEGIGSFIYETLRHICPQHPEDEFFFIFDRNFDESFIFSDNITPIILSPQARHPVLYYTWFNFSLPPLLKSLQTDVFLSPDGYIPLPYKGKILNVIHDLNFAHNPKDFPWLERWYYNHFFPRFAGQSTRIATVSEFSKSDIMSTYGIPADRIDNVYSGLNDYFHPVDETLKQETRQKFTGGSEYFVFIGSLIPRKNLARLFQAFDLFKEDDHDDIKLLVVGAKKWWTSALREVFYTMKHRKDVIFTGRLPDEDTNNVLASAIGLTFVSYFEGFGLPTLEGFATGTPVITSNLTAIPEVAGDAALLVDPYSPPSIAEAMTRLAKDEKLRKELAEKGKQRLSLFTWQKTSDLLWESILKTFHS